MGENVSKNSPKKNQRSRRNKKGGSSKRRRQTSSERVSSEEEDGYYTAEEKRNIRREREWYEIRKRASEAAAENAQNGKDFDYSRMAMAIGGRGPNQNAGAPPPRKIFLPENPTIEEIKNSIAEMKKEFDEMFGKEEHGTAVARAKGLEQVAEGQESELEEGEIKQ